MHGVGPEEAEVVAHAQRVRGFGYHAAAFLGVMAITGPQFWFAFWGIGLFAHFSRTAPSMAWLRKTGRPLGALLGFHVKSGALPAPVTAPEPEASSPEPVAADPLESSVREEWARVRELLPDGDAARALEEAWAGVEGAVRRRAALLATLEGESEDELEADIARLEAEAAGADAVTREVLEGSRRAVGARLEALRTARTAEVRLRARVEAMLHQLKAVRLGLVARPAPTSLDLAAQVGALRDEARAAAELEEAPGRSSRARPASGPASAAELIVWVLRGRPSPGGDREPCGRIERHGPPAPAPRPRVAARGRIAPPRLHVAHAKRGR